MTKKVDISPSELVLSAIFFLQQKNGVSEKEITKFISKKLGCKQSSVSKEVKEALDKAIENGIFTKKQGLYRIESSLGSDLKSIERQYQKKNMAKPEKEKSGDDFDLQEEIQSSFKGFDNTDDRWLNSQSSKSDRISLDKLDFLKNKSDDDEDFLEDDDDELDFFEDDQFTDSFNFNKESSPPVRSRCSKKGGRRGHKHKNGNGRKKRKPLKTRKRHIKRKKQQVLCTCKNSEYSHKSTAKSSRRQKGGNESRAKEDGGHRKQRKQNRNTEECDTKGEVSKRGKKGKKAKETTAYGGTRFCRECNCITNTVQEEKRNGQTQEPSESSKGIVPKEDQMKKSVNEEQLKRKGKDTRNNDEKEASKKAEDTTSKKDTKEPSNAIKAANPQDVPPEREWRRKKAKRERSSSLFRPIKKKVSCKDKSSLEQKSAKQKISK